MNPPSNMVANFVRDLTAGIKRNGKAIVASSLGVDKKTLNNWLRGKGLSNAAWKHEKEVARLYGQPIEVQGDSTWTALLHRERVAKPGDNEGNAPMVVEALIECVRNIRTVKNAAAIRCLKETIDAGRICVRPETYEAVAIDYLIFQAGIQLGWQDGKAFRDLGRGGLRAINAREVSSDETSNFWAAMAAVSLGREWMLQASNCTGIDRIGSLKRARTYFCKVSPSMSSQRLAVPAVWVSDEQPEGYFERVRQREFTEATRHVWRPHRYLTWCSQMIGFEYLLLGQLKEANYWLGRARDWHRDWLERMHSCSENQRASLAYFDVSNDQLQYLLCKDLTERADIRKKGLKKINALTATAVTLRPDLSVARLLAFADRVDPGVEGQVSTAREAYGLQKGFALNVDDAAILLFVRLPEILRN